MHRVALILTIVLSATPAVAGENWPQFRGPGGDGHSDAVGLPVTWSESENVLWKTPIHGRGHSSPVVWGDQVWMTTATPDGKQMFAVCVDRNSGKVLHDVGLFTNEVLQITHSLNSFASPTPVIEQGRVYVSFGTYGIACLDTATGRRVWARRDLNCDHFRGPGSSPFLFGNLLIQHYDGFDVQFVVALEKATGKTVWKTGRSTEFANDNGDFHKAFCTPIAIRSGGREQLISPAAQAAMAYDPHTGEELWRVRWGGHSTASRPLFGHGLVYLNTGFGKAQLWAVRPGGHGDVTDTHVAWKLMKGVPSKPSPLLVRELIFMVDDGGVASCVDARTGQIVWQERLGGEYSASPVYADGRIYFFPHQGPATVIEPGRQLKVLAENELDEGFMASPAVVGKALILRTKTHLYRIQRQDPPPPGRVP